ncbi:unnamed protein product [Paramecium primaurelia]|uniref:EF-hand domain-containing protein n=1 Tax=Paramecium primaurelia TaxID=5886 RepID=A0A8S1KMF4_PARPR|nr:unnamed protein product [Paramecium primaurelia]
MSESENFKLRREIIQLKKQIEQLREDGRQKDQRIAFLEAEQEFHQGRYEEQKAKYNDCYTRMRELEKMVNRDDAYTKETLKNQLEKAKDDLDREKAAVQQYIDQLEKVKLENGNLMWQLTQLSLKYKDENIVKDEFHYRDEVQDNREKLKNLVEKTNALNQAIERLSAENRVLRKMAGVPDDYQFELDDVIQEGQLQVEKYRAQVIELEREVEELEEERARLRRKLREQVAGGEVNLEEFDSQSNNQLRKENQELRSKVKMLEEENAHIRQNQQDYGGMGMGTQQGFMKITNDQMQEMMQKQQQELKEQLQEIVKTMKGQNFQETTQIKQSIIQQKQVVDTTGLDKLSVPPNPIPGAFGNYNDIKEGYSQRFNVRFPVDMSSAYSDSGMDQMQLKYELASLQLQNIETLRLLQQKEAEYTNLLQEVVTIKEDIKGKCLLVQDQLFVKYIEERDKFKAMYGEIQEKYKAQLDLNVEAKIKLAHYEDFMRDREKPKKELEDKLGEMAKRTAILDVNLIKLSRKYDALTEEYKQMKTSYTIVESESMAKEKELLEKIYNLISWKKSAEEHMRVMIKELKNSVPADEFNNLRQKLEYTQDKLANAQLKEAEFQKRIATLESHEREAFERGERIRQLEEELVEIQLEEEVIKKRLQSFDPAFDKYVKIYQHIVEFIKIKNISVIEIFKLFDENGDNKISRNEFTTAIGNIGVPVTNEDMEIVFMFVDLDGTGQIEYQEFIRKLKRSGINLRKPEDQLLYQLYNAIKESGYDLRSAFQAFDTNCDNIISKADMKEALIQMNIKHDQKAIDYIFRMADTSGDNQINYEEFYVLFDEIVKSELINQGKSIQLTLDIKYQIMCKLDQSIKDQRLTLLDVFNMIDRDGDQIITLIEFQALFRELEGGISPDLVRQLFDQMDLDRNGQISYNEMLNYLRTAKTEEEKYQKLQFIQQRTEQLKSLQETDLTLQKAKLENKGQTLEDRLKMKISILEMREKNAQQKCEVLLNQLTGTELKLKDTTKTLFELQNQMERSNDTFYRDREEKLLLLERLKGALSREESEKLTKQIEQQRLTISDQNSAITTYRQLYDTAVMQTKSMKLTIEKIKNDSDTMQQTIKELQAISDQNMMIGKLYHHLMVARWHEAQTNQKYEKVLDELRKLKLQSESYDTTILKQSQEIIQQNTIFSEQIRSYEQQITELKLKILPTVTLQRVEEQAKRVKELSDMKSEVERQNRELRDRFYELQLKADYFDNYKEKLDNLERTLRQNNPDELSQQIITVSQKLSDEKIELLRVRREMQVSAEKQEYYQRLNKQYTDTIKKLEYELAHADLDLRKREEDWRKRFYEQRKTIFAQLGLIEKDDMKEFSQKNTDASKMLIDAIQKKQKEQMEQQNQPPQQQQIEVSQLEKRIQELEAQVKAKNIEIEGYIERQKIVAGGSVVFQQQQLEDYTKTLLAQEAEKVSVAGQQMLKAMQEIIKDKDRELERKEQQIEAMRQETLLHKKKDISEIQRLTDLLHKRDQAQQEASKLGNNNNYNNFSYLQQNQMSELQPVLIEKYQQQLSEKDRKIKDLELSFEAEKNALKKVKEELIKTIAIKEQLEIDLENEKKLNESMQYVQKIEKLQNLVNEKNTQLASLKKTVVALKEEQFKIAGESINKEQVYKTKEAKLNNNTTELETRLTKMVNDMKLLKEEIKDKQKKLEQLQEKEIQNRAQMTDLQKKNSELKAIIQAGGGKLEEQDQTVSNIQAKLQQFNQMSMEKVQLEREIQFLKQQGGTRELFDKDATLKPSTGLYFKTFPDLLDTLKQYLITKPKFDLLIEFKKLDKQFTQILPMAKFFEVLSNAGVKLKTRDQKLVIDTIKTKDENADYYTKFYYVYKGWSDNVVQTDQDDKQQQQQQQQQIQQQQSQKFSLKNKK